VPAFGFLWSDEDVYACHERRYTKATLTRQLERAGFEIEYVSYYFRALLLPILLLRTLPYRLTSWRKKPGQAQTMDQTEHNPQGLGQRIVARLLERELREIGRGERLAFGSSLVAVARRR
jgi:hypothetical protein